MYTVPSYVTYRTEEDAIYITSELYRNTVRLTDHGLQKEFINLTRCGGCAELNTPLTRYLHEQELLVTEEELDHALHQVRSLLDNIFMVTLMPTEGCNFRCPYCYEDHHAVSMTRDTLDRIEEYITAQAPRYKQVILAWFGGEPTLCKDTVLEVSNIVQNLQKQYGFHYAANMTTNGYLLNDKLFRQFYQAGITSYQITIDGWNHDKTRPHVSGKEPCRPSLTIWPLFPSCRRQSIPFISRCATIFWPTMRTTVGMIICTVCLGMTNASPYLFVLLVTGVVKASTVYPSFIRIQKMCW